MVYSKVGIEDPEALGKIYGGFNAVYRTLALDKRRISISFEPVFMQNYIELDSCIVIRTSIIQILAPFAIAIVTFPYLSTFLVWHRYRRLTKETEGT